MKHIHIALLLLILSFTINATNHTQNITSVHIATNSDLFKNKRILILGGTGYLGRAILTEVLKYNPEKVIIFSRDEVKHFNISKMYANNPKVETVLGDIRNYKSVYKATKNCDIVFHVAALKRIDTIETNVEEAIQTNLIGSLNVFDACVENNVDKVLFISTDKACSPINAYGACKFVSEKIFTNYDKRKISTKFLVTRFGNILESTGSVIPIFTDKIKNGHDIPLTDDRMTRFIIGKDEAVALIFDALRYGTGGEIFVKKLPAMRIIDLIEILKKKYNAVNPIKIIGLRPGEKIHELLINESEMARASEFNNCFIIRPSVLWLNHTEMEEVPFYIMRGQPADCLENYESSGAVLAQEELSGLFKELKLI